MGFAFFFIAEYEHNIYVFLCTAFFLVDGYPLLHTLFFFIPSMCGLRSNFMYNCELHLDTSSFSSLSMINWWFDMADILTVIVSVFLFAFGFSSLISNIG